MSWNCSNCSTSNEETESRCIVCDTPRSATPAVTGGRGRSEDGECKVCFSDFEAFVEAVKELFSKRT